MQKLFVAGLLSLAVALPANAAFTSSGRTDRSEAAKLQLAGYGRYANCVMGKIASLMQHGGSEWSVLTPFHIGVSISCFEAY